MKVSLIQMDLAWRDAAANRERAEQLMLGAEKSDLYVLPEMWNTGVTTEPEGIAEEDGGETVQWMQRMADHLDAAVAGSIAVKECPLPAHSSGKCLYYNRLYFVKPKRSSASQGLSEDGSGEETVFYNKHHLFSYGGETLHYTPGAEKATAEWRGLRFRLSVCYDLRFPIWLRNTDDYDVLICVASWPDVRTHAWNVLLQARAIENQCYVLGVNRVGSDPVCHYRGGTQVVDPFGNATSCADGETAVLTMTLDMKRLRAFREKFPVLREIDKTEG